MDSQGQTRDLDELAAAFLYELEANGQLSPQCVEGVLLALRSHLDGVSPADIAFPYRVEAIGDPGAPATELAVTSSRDLAWAAFEEAAKTPGRKVRLTYAAQELASSA